MDERLNVPSLGSEPEDFFKEEDSNNDESMFGDTLQGKDLVDRLKRLNYLLVETCITNLEKGKVKTNDLGAIVTLLKNNKIIEEQKDVDPSDEIDDLIEKKR